MAKLFIGERKTKRFGGGHVDMEHDAGSYAGLASLTVRADGSLFVYSEEGGLELTKAEAIEALESALAFVRRGR